ncbi:hypothetical protein FCM35_KLT15990 [Carex littledalei]|uniref:Uncharacterized protein n=1 Tax=Carex littledalei TaxID=544730 RepID=A0A833RWU0_9POAL|nr:hypothetical protein FCM35_KLT15990 [Carex littledalei]
MEKVQFTKGTDCRDFFRLFCLFFFLPPSSFNPTSLASPSLFLSLSLNWRHGGNRRHPGQHHWWALFMENTSYLRQSSGAHSASNSGSAGSPSKPTQSQSAAPLAAMTPDSESTFVRLNNLDIHVDETMGSSQTAARLPFAHHIFFSDCCKIIHLTKRN